MSFWAISLTFLSLHDGDQHVSNTLDVALQIEAHRLAAPPPTPSALPSGMLYVPSSLPFLVNEEIDETAAATVTLWRDGAYVASEAVALMGPFLWPLLRFENLEPGNYTAEARVTVDADVPPSSARLESDSSPPPTVRFTMAVPPLLQPREADTVVLSTFAGHDANMALTVNGVVKQTLELERLFEQVRRSFVWSFVARAPCCPCCPCCCCCCSC